MSNETTSHGEPTSFELPANMPQVVVARIAASLRVPGVSTSTLEDANVYPVFGSIMRVTTTGEGMQWIKRISSHPLVIAASHLISADLLEQHATLEDDDSGVSSDAKKSEAIRERAKGMQILEAFDGNHPPIPEKLIGESVEDLLRSTE